MTELKGKLQLWLYYWLLRPLSLCRFIVFNVTEGMQRSFMYWTIDILQHIRHIWPLTRVEDLLLRMARSGQIQRKVSEQELVALLNQIAQTKSESKIVFNRKGDVGLDDLTTETTQADQDDDDFFD